MCLFVIRSHYVVLTSSELSIIEQTGIKLPAILLPLPPRVHHHAQPRFQFEADCIIAYSLFASVSSLVKYQLMKKILAQSCGIYLQSQH